jgi:hypothetical protein
VGLRGSRQNDNTIVLVKREMVRGRYSIHISKSECRSGDFMRTSLLLYDIRIGEVQALYMCYLVGVSDNRRVIRDLREHIVFALGCLCQASIERIEKSFDIEKPSHSRIGLQKPVAVYT